MMPFPALRQKSVQKYYIFLKYANISAIFLHIYEKSSTFVA